MAKVSTSNQALLSGNEALAYGAHEAGLKVACAYPGTPSTEILETLAQFPEVDAQWSVNQKVAFEVALGAAIAGARSLFACKHVGLNVAMDPLMTASYTGILAGFVVAVCDAMKTIALIVSLAVAGMILSSCARLQTPDRAAAVEPPSSGAPLAPVPFTWPENKRAAVSLSFDDARASQVDIGVPLLDAYGIKATFYVSLATLRAKLPAWKAALAAGHEIGNHSLRHPCTGNFPFARERALEDYTLEQMATELDQANVEIETLLGVHPVTFAYPCGQKFVGRGIEVRSYVPLVASRFLAGRGWRDEGPNDPAFCDLAQLMTMELDGLTWEQLKALIDQTVQRGFWLVLCGHDIRESGRQTTRTDTLRAFCEYAQDPQNGLWVDTVANVARHVAERRAVPAQR